MKAGRLLSFAGRLYGRALFVSRFSANLSRGRAYFSTNAIRDNARAYGIADDSSFYNLKPPTQQQLLDLYSQGEVQAEDFADDVWTALAEFEEPTATGIVSRFSKSRKMPTIKDDAKKAYFFGFINRYRRSGEGLRAPPRREQPFGSKFIPPVRAKPAADGTAAAHDSKVFVHARRDPGDWRARKMFVMQEMFVAMQQCEKVTS